MVARLLRIGLACRAAPVFADLAAADLALDSTLDLALDPTWDLAPDLAVLGGFGGLVMNAL
jgi:hypothetical protein